MSQASVRAFPFGGVGEFGKNFMVYAVGKNAVIVDCGMGFPEPGQHGIDLVIPDISALHKMGLKIHALLLTHGHEDHIGAVPFLLPQLKCPVYGTEVTLALVRNKLSEAKIKGDLRALPKSGSIDIGPFPVQAIAVTHSIMDAVSLAIGTPYGWIVHTGDFRFDPSPIDGRVSELHRFAALGDEGVILLASDSTNATRPGSGLSESSIGPHLRLAIESCKKKVFVTTFASNMFRLQQIIDAATACGRKIVLAGRSLERNVEVALNLNRLTIPTGQMISVKEAQSLPASELLYIATGSQGEYRAGLARIAQDRFTGVSLSAGDLVIFSSSAIPGNERSISYVFNHIYRRGARVLHAGQAPLHVSGHAQAHELTTMMQLTRPVYFYPVHGEYRYLFEHQRLAHAIGIKPEHTILAENGQSVVLDAEGIRHGDRFDAGAVFVDGSLRGEVDYAVLRDRRVLSDDGFVTAIVVIQQQTGMLLGEPEIISRGVLRKDLTVALLNEVQEGLFQHLQALDQELLSDAEAIHEVVRLWLRRWFKRQFGRRPMILPSIIEV